MASMFRANIREYFIPRFCNMEFNLPILQLNTKKIGNFAEEVLRGAKFTYIEVSCKNYITAFYLCRVLLTNLYFANKLIRELLFLYMASPPILDSLKVFYLMKL